MKYVDKHFRALDKAEGHVTLQRRMGRNRKNK